MCTGNDVDEPASGHFCFQLVGPLPRTVAAPGRLTGSNPILLMLVGKLFLGHRLIIAFSEYEIPMNRWNTERCRGEQLFSSKTDPINSV